MRDRHQTVSPRLSTSTQLNICSSNRPACVITIVAWPIETFAPMKLLFAAGLQNGLMPSLRSIQTGLSSARRSRNPRRRAHTFRSAFLWRAQQADSRWRSKTARDSRRPQPLQLHAGPRLLLQSFKTPGRNSSSLGTSTNSCSSTPRMASAHDGAAGQGLRSWP